jgi:hypothetical protein
MEPAPDCLQRSRRLSGAEDIVNSNLFTGIHGNYLRASIIAAGMDPDNLPEADPSAMDFGSGGNQSAKAWADIWGCGQGIGAVNDIPTAAEFIERLAAQYEHAQAELAAKTHPFVRFADSSRDQRKYRQGSCSSPSRSSRLRGRWQAWRGPLGSPQRLVRWLVGWC